MPEELTTLDYIPEWLQDRAREHLDHPWMQIGRCVYCGPCSTRLYNGTLPPPQPVAAYLGTEPPRKKKPSASQQMRERWNKD